MNPFFTNVLPMNETIMRQPPPKKVLNVLENLCNEPGNLNSTLFLGDLAVLCDEMNLYELFSRFGVIKTIQLKRSDRDPQRAHLGFGFVKFASHDSAQRALRETNGYFFLGRCMRVDWAADHGKKQCQVGENPKKEQTAQIHVMFVTRELNRRVSELDLGGVFSRYGNLVDIAIKKNAMSADYGVQSGYAFVHFSLTPEGLKSAVTAVEEVNNLIIDKIAYQCKVTHTLQMHLCSMNYVEEPFVMNHLPRNMSSNSSSHLSTYTSISRQSSVPEVPYSAPLELMVLQNHSSLLNGDHFGAHHTLTSTPAKSFEPISYYDRMNHYQGSSSLKPSLSPSSFSFPIHSPVGEAATHPKNRNMMFQGETYEHYK